MPSASPAVTHGTRAGMTRSAESAYALVTTVPDPAPDRPGAAARGRASPCVVMACVPGGGPDRLGRAAHHADAAPAARAGQARRPTRSA